MCSLDDLVISGDSVLVIRTPDGDHGKGYELVCAGGSGCVADFDSFQFGDHRFT